MLGVHAVHSACRCTSGQKLVLISQNKEDVRRALGRCYLKTRLEPNEDYHQGAAFLLLAGVAASKQGARFLWEMKPLSKRMTPISQKVSPHSLSHRQSTLVQRRRCCISHYERLRGAGSLCAMLLNLLFCRIDVKCSSHDIVLPEKK
jgi:hypothetical protein